MACHKRRRGIVLLVVLALLALFALTAATFLLVSGQYQRAALSNARSQRFDSTIQPMLDGALYQVLRDTSDTRSVLRGHSLLLDMYGVGFPDTDTNNDGILDKESLGLGGFQGTLEGVAATTTGGQFLQLTVRENNVSPIVGTHTFALSRITGSYNGRVMTFTTGPAKGSSVRIVAYAYDGTVSPARATFRVMPPATEQAAVVSLGVGNAFIVNGRPFSGTGFGFNPASFASNAELLNIGDLGADGVSGTADDLALAALLPNMANLTPTTARTAFLLEHFGRSNESYDIPDFQNMALGALMGDATDPVVFPSYHRPDLVHYWFKWMRDNLLTPIQPEFHLEVFLLPYGRDNRPMTADDRLPPVGTPPVVNPILQRVAEIKRRIIFRPLLESHPSFSGSSDGLTHAYLLSAAGRYEADILNGVPPDTASLVNPYLFNFSSQPIAYDVDNDGDGVRDGIWLDVGLPVRTSREGRMVKPLVSILALDLDGRLNINAHGTLAHVPGTYFLAPAAASYLAGNATSSTLPKGQGYGPPEINLSALFTSLTQYELLLRGDSTLQVPGRYGWDQAPGVSGLDPLAYIRFFEFPDNYSDFVTATNRRSFQTPPDLRGELAMGVDHRGQPAYEVSNITTRAESPYEVDLSATASRGMLARGVKGPPNPAVVYASDAPFSPAELERLLRTNDPDARLLPDRLSRFFPEWFNSTATHRRAVTTESADLPVPTTGRADAAHVLQLFRARILTDSGLTEPLTVQQEQAVNRALLNLVPHDLFMGLRMDLNRPFGNAEDNNNNGVVDEHGTNFVNALEARLIETIWPVSPNKALVDHDNDGVTAGDQDAWLARYHMARHLYCLLMALKDPTFRIDHDGDGTTSDEETAVALAQWAINVVDFRDPDSIMTPFEFDLNPFNVGPGINNVWEPNNPNSDDERGWDVDGRLDTSEDVAFRRVVWGCERPELLISEIVAFHDRRTEDLANPNGRTTDTPDGESDGRNDFDQRFRPWGSLYIELYNPWASDQERIPAELTNNGGVALNKQYVANSPVWRLSVSDVSPIDPDTTGAPNPERLIYFTATGPASPGARVYTNSLPVAPIRGGRYAVVGTVRQIEPTVVDPETSLPAGGVGYINYIGRRPDGDAALTRRVVMYPDPTVGADPDVNWFYVLNNGTEANPPQRLYPGKSDGIANMQPPVAVPIFGLEISEGDYPTVDANGNDFDTFTGTYLAPWDLPFDEDPDRQIDPRLSQDGTISSFRQVHLQRLANPLVAYDAVLNPYRTIDSAIVDLTVFNGVAATSGPSVTAGGYEFGTRERGTATPVRGLWHQTSTPPSASTAGGVPDHHFTHQLTHSLGYLNSVFDPRFVKDFSGAGGGGTQAPADKFVGAPDSTTATTTFPWLTWNNRPYVSQYELTLVPRSRSARLLKDFTLLVGATPYNPDPANLPPYGHLLNFFATQSQAEPNGPNLYEIFEYTGVPSRFVETDTWLNPGFFQANNTGTEYFHPPFNRVSHYRDPGRININTAYSAIVWSGLLGGHSSPAYLDWIQSRRGYDFNSSANDPIAEMTRLNPLYPTIFANPFRGGRAGDLAPLPDMRRAHVDCTLLRAKLDSTPTDVNDDVPLCTTSSTSLHNETSRHPYFQYQSAQRLANLVTTRSNVYAIWITAGFFEVDPNTQKLGQEAGLETGEVQRHRAFFIVDRSIPVAFEPGENHNVDRAVLLRRFIE